MEKYTLGTPCMYSECLVYSWNSMYLQRMEKFTLGTQCIYIEWKSTLLENHVFTVNGKVYTLGTPCINS